MSSVHISLLHRVTVCVCRHIVFWGQAPGLDPASHFSSQHLEDGAGPWQQLPVESIRAAVAAAHTSPSPALPHPPAADGIWEANPIWSQSGGDLSSTRSGQ